MIGLFLSAPWKLCAQNAKIDSLKSTLNQELTDQDRVDTYNALAFQTFRILPDTAKSYAGRAMQLAKVASYTKGTANSHNSFGFIAFSQGEYDSALWHYEQFRHISQMIGDSVSMSRALNNLGVLFSNQGQLEEALQSYEQSLAIRASLGSETGLGTIYNNLGLMQMKLGNYREALDYYLKAIEAKRRPDRVTGRAMAYLNLANLKELLEDYEGSEEAFQKAYAIYQANNDQKGMAVSFHNMAETHTKQGDFQKALALYQQSVRINRQLKNRKQLAENLNAIASLHYDMAAWDSSAYYLSEAQAIAQQLQIPFVHAKIALGFGHLYHTRNQPNLALSHAEKSYEEFLTLGVKKEIAASAYLISQVYKTLGNSSKAYDFLTTYLTYQDSLMNENKATEIAKIEFNYDLSKVESEKQRLLEAQEVMGTTLSENQRRIDGQRQTIIWGGVILFLVVISSIFIVHFYQQVRKTRNSLREANKEISEFNQSLEQKIQDRTQKIEKQNKQLMDYAFAISHEIRSPLTNLIGFLDLDDQHEINEFSDEEKRQIKSSMANSIQKIDEATRKAAQIGHPKDKRTKEN
ncbi:MAG: tetratricopeptide repeat protein [Cytophagales bacterium]|nr:tetratricopeptide repeat protein [Cytophagales bacterium]